DLVFPEVPAQKDGLATAQRRKVDEAFVEILYLDPQIDDVVDGAGRLTRRPLHLGGGVRELRGRDAPAVPADPTLELLLALERLDVRSPMLDHPLDERPNLDERCIRLLGGEVAHACNPMRRW